VGGYCGAGWDLDLAFHKLDWSQYETCECSGYCSCEPEGGEREGLRAGIEVAGEEELAAYALPEEEGGGFERGADEGSGDPAVEGVETV
jgi:hypothetical protein